MSRRFYGKHLYLEELTDMTYLTPPDEKWIKGMHVRHRKFGEAIVLSMYEGSLLMKFKDTGSAERWSWERFISQKDADGLTVFIHSESFLKKLITRNLVAAELQILAPLTAIAISPSIDNLPVLGSHDYRLCLAWANQNHVGNVLSAGALVALIGEYEAARLMSARVAELAAIKYYRAMGHQVIDISVTQIEAGSSGDWQEIDLLVDDRPVDVKNARRSFSNEEWYVEHVVAKFKAERNSKKNISILGVLSSYEFASDIERAKGSCIILGEVSINEIRNLYKWTKVRFGTLIDFQGMWDLKLQPGWVFEYPPEMYTDRMEIAEKARSSIRRLIDKLDPEDIRGFMWSLSTGWINDENLPALLSNEKQSILSDIQKLFENVGRTRPALYMYTVGYLLEALADGRSWSLSGKLLYEMLEMPEWGDKNFSSTMLGLSDPLGYLHALFGIFEAIFSHVASTRISFKAFKLISPKILKGNTSSGDWITLFAYCGGWIKEPFQVKCGNTPLYLGRHDNCLFCGYLVCDVCGFCQSQCELLTQRQQIVQRNQVGKRHKQNANAGWTFKPRLN